MTSTAPASDPTILASKRAVYVGGLAESVTPQLLRAAMIPFGPIKSLDMVSLRCGASSRHGIMDVVGPFLITFIFIVSLSFLYVQPMDYAQGHHKGFGFVEYEDAEDASEAIFNMDGADLMGRTIRVSMAQMNQLSKLSTTSQQAIWSSDEWFQKYVVGQPTPEEQESLQAQSQDQQALRD